MPKPNFEIIKHRMNSIEDLKQHILGTSYGVEIDVRYHNEDLILAHDPFSHQALKPVALDEYLKSWGDHPQTLIVNLKTEGIEKRCFELFNEYKTKQWFFLDMSTPFLIQYALDKKETKIPKKHIAVRWSEYESLDLAMGLQDNIAWVWLDCFTKYPDWDCPEFYLLKEKGVRFCIVAPELQGHNEALAEKILKKIEHMPFDAICTKREGFWQKKNGIK